MPLRFLRCTPRAAWLALALTFASPGAAALAQADSYDATIARAVSEFDQSHWDEANALFRRAHELNPSARTWRGLGLTSFELRRYVDAIAELEAARADPRKPLTPKLRSEVEDVLKRARDFVSVYRVRISPGDAEVILDGHPVNVSSGEIMLDPGPHTIAVRAPGYREREAQLRAAAGKKEDMTIELMVAEPAPSPEVETAPQPVAQPAPPPPPPEAPPRRYPWTIGLAAGTVVGGAVSIGVGVATGKKSDDVSRCVRDDGDCQGLVDSGRTLQTTTNVAIGVTGALAVGAVVAFLLERREPTARSAEHSAIRWYPTASGIGGTF